MRLLQLLKEAKQVGTIYHFTTNENVLEILASNELRAENRGISFTRNKNYLNEPGSYGKGINLVRLSIDGDKLSENYKIAPFHNVSKYNKEGDEFEEKISIKDLKNGVINNIKKFEYDNLVDLLQFRHKYGMSKIGEMAKEKSTLEFKKFYDELKRYNIPIKEQVLNNKL